MIDNRCKEKKEGSFYATMSAISVKDYAETLLHCFIHMFVIHAEHVHDQAPSIVSDVLRDFDIEEFVIRWMTFIVKFIVVNQANHLSTPPHDE